MAASRDARNRLHFVSQWRLGAGRTDMPLRVARRGPRRRGRPDVNFLPPWPCSAADRPSRRGPAGTDDYSSWKASSRFLRSAGSSTTISASAAIPSMVALIGLFTNTIGSLRESSNARRRYSSIIGPMM